MLGVGGSEGHPSPKRGEFQPMSASSEPSCQPEQLPRVSPGQENPRLVRLNVLGLRQWLPVSALPGYLAAQATVARGPLLFSGALSEGQFYSPPESFAGDGLVGGGTAFREGIYKEWDRLALFFLFLLSVPWGKPASHTHFHPPHILHLYPNPTTSPPLPIVICACSLQDLTMNQMKKLLGRKASLPRYLAAHPHPAFRAGTQETGQCWAQPGWVGAPQQRGDLSSLNASAHLSVGPHCLSGPLVYLLPGNQCGVATATAPGPRNPAGPRRPAHTHI